MAVTDSFCWGCAWQGAIPDFPCGFALTLFLSHPHDNREQLGFKAMLIDPAVEIIFDWWPVGTVDTKLKRS